MRNNPVTLLNITQVCKILNVTEPTLAEWREQGIGPDFIVLSHNTVKYSLDAIMDYLRDSKVFEMPFEGGPKAVKRPH